MLPDPDNQKFESYKVQTRNTIDTKLALQTVIKKTVTFDFTTNYRTKCEVTDLWSQVQVCAVEGRAEPHSKFIYRALNSKYTQLLQTALLTILVAKSFQSQVKLELN